MIKIKEQTTLGKIPEGFKVTKCPEDPRLKAVMESGVRDNHRISTIMLPSNFINNILLPSSSQAASCHQQNEPNTGSRGEKYIWDKIAMTARTFIWLSMRHADGLFFVSDQFYANHIWPTNRTSLTKVGLDKISSKDIASGRKVIEDWLVDNDCMERVFIPSTPLASQAISSPQSNGEPPPEPETKGRKKGTVMFRMNLDRMFGYDRLPQTDRDRLDPTLRTMSHAARAVFFVKAKHLFGPGSIWYFTDPVLTEHIANVYKTSAIKKRESKILSSYRNMKRESEAGLLHGIFADNMIPDSSLL